MRRVGWVGCLCGSDLAEEGVGLVLPLPYVRMDTVLKMVSVLALTRPDQPLPVHIRVVVWEGVVGEENGV